MKNRLLRIVSFIVAAALVMSLAACGNSGKKDMLARIKEKGTLVIGTEGNWSPWTYHDENDQLVGLDIEIGTLIANLQEYKDAIDQGDAQRLYELLAEGDRLKKEADG